MLKMVVALILVVAFGLSSALFTLAMAIFIWAGQSQIASAFQGATEIPLIGPLVMLAISVVMMWVGIVVAIQILKSATRTKSSKQ